MNDSALDATYLAEQYEALRREALCCAAETRRGHGMALFLTHGMVRWIDAISTVRCRQTPSTEGLTTLPIAVPPEITTVLANMVLVCMQEAQG